MNNFANVLKRIITSNLLLIVFAMGLVASTSYAALSVISPSPGISQASESQGVAEESDDSQEVQQSEGQDIQLEDSQLVAESRDADLVQLASTRNFVSNVPSANSSVSKNASVAKVPTQVSTSLASTNSLTLATLALHNKSGDCYIAYNGTVYDVSNHASWSGCSHHGARGGADITSVFPHSTSYFNSLPVVGSLSGGTIASNNPKQSYVESEDDDDEWEDSDDDSSDDDEYENEIEDD